jgi:hypothetical protein
MAVHRCPQGMAPNLAPSGTKAANVCATEWIQHEVTLARSVRFYRSAHDDVDAGRQLEELGPASFSA